MTTYIAIMHVWHSDRPQLNFWLACFCCISSCFYCLQRRLVVGVKDINGERGGGICMWKHRERGVILVDWLDLCVREQRDL
jgi:hypothetical protein